MCLCCLPSGLACSAVAPFAAVVSLSRFCSVVPLFLHPAIALLFRCFVFLCLPLPTPLRLHSFVLLSAFCCSLGHNTPVCTRTACLPLYYERSNSPLFFFTSLTSHSTSFSLSTFCPPFFSALGSVTFFFPLCPRCYPPTARPCALVILRYTLYTVLDLFSRMR